MTHIHTYIYIIFYKEKYIISFNRNYRKNKNRKRAKKSEREKQVFTGIECIHSVCVCVYTYTIYTCARNIYI